MENQSRMQKFFLIGGLLAFIVSESVSAVWAQGSIKGFVDNLEEVQAGLTLWDMLQQGGVIMIVLAIMSVLAVTIIVYNFITLNVSKLAPRSFAEEVIEKLDEGHHAAVKTLCQRRHNIIANVVMSGLEKKTRGAVFTREAMETTVRQELSTLWQNISYLADIAAIAPLVGLLGTVIGMIQAFNVIAFQDAVVKPILLAGGVSKAMITTAGGLIVAIPVMLFYSYFRGRVQDVTNIVESYSTDIIKIVEDHSQEQQTLDASA